jgi:hypothetical protein
MAAGIPGMAAGAVKRGMKRAENALLLKYTGEFPKGEQYGCES